MSNLKIRIWDVKHGNAIYVQTPNSKNLVFDLGRGDYSENSDDRSPLETLYDHYGVRQIDYLTITHPHRDHIDDILNIDKFYVQILSRPRNLDQQAILNSASSRDRAKYVKYFELDERYVLGLSSNRDTSFPSNYGGVSIEHFQTASLPETNLNNRSIFTVLSYLNMKIIIPGDNEYDSLNLLMQRTDFKTAIKDCDILIAPHHGRESAYHTEFVKLANPLLTIVSDGSLCDTSANYKYTQNSRGWTVWKNGKNDVRKLLTTNSDGEVYIDMGNNSTQNFLQVVIK